TIPAVDTPARRSPHASGAEGTRRSKGARSARTRQADEVRRPKPARPHAAWLPEGAFWRALLSREGAHPARRTRPVEGDRPDPQARHEAGIRGARLGNAGPVRAGL